ncbi:hypothetical protein [Thalassolituus oleivorans]|jgi:hypothetical protein|uniref:hypothetical protein n=1 Tax=Thalassolituus oleivorans TaxID=187493 RepID=UPI00042DC2B4|nr:hypothetical protein [Thalassolituus oleivorans]AHK17278.1 hypothetical protein R615_02785 [Thalassolituus oleivorans R6-15]
MEIDQDKFMLMKNVELLCREVVMSIGYSNYLNNLLVEEHSPSELGNDLWIYCKISCASIGILKWCSVFGSERGEKTYWEKMSLPNQDSIKNEIFTALNVDEDKWLELRTRARTLRDKFVAHNDFKDTAPNLYKDTQPFKVSASVLRDEILTCFRGIEINEKEAKEYLSQIVLVPSSELEKQVKEIYDLGVKNANKALHSDV